MQGLAQILLDKMRMMRDDAVAVAHVVQDAFRGEDEVEDDELDTHLRQLFYDLQDADVLSVRRHEYRNEEGRLLRGYSWHLRDNEIRRETPRPESLPDPTQEIYDQLAPEAWERRRAPQL